MTNSNQTAIIVPCYNESERFQASAFQEQVKQHPGLHFFFVNDGSRDGTLGMLKEASQSMPGQMHIVNLPVNRGKAEAVRQGMLAASLMGFDFVGFWDADLATPLVHIHDFEQELIQNNEIILVMGSRVKLLGRKIERQPVRHYLGRVFATCASLILDLPVYDTQCGAKLFRNGPSLLRAFEEPFTSSWIFDVEILARFTQQSNMTQSLIVEYPLQEWTDVPGSKIKPKDLVKVGLQLLQIARKYK